VDFSIVRDPAGLRHRSVGALINDSIASSPHLNAFLEPLAPTARPQAAFSTNARARRAATDDAALVGNSGSPAHGIGGHALSL
jgi:hypothetical protein